MSTAQQKRTDVLGKVLDERIEVQAVFDRLATVYKGTHQIVTALIQDAYVIADEELLDIGHVWLQFAHNLSRYSLKPGDRLKCTCRVRHYKKHHDGHHPSGHSYEWRYSLCYPESVEVYDRLPVSPLITREPEPPPDPDSEEELDELPAAANKPDRPLGSKNKPEPPEEEVSLTPVQVLLEVKRVVKLAGGVDELRQLLDLFA